MKIIFLDFDGVLNSEHIEPILAMLEKVLDFVELPYILEKWRLRT